MLQLLPFRPFTKGRLRRARWTSLLIGLSALALYLLTVDSCAFPGDSATWIAWVANLDTREVPTHPLLTALGQAVSGLPVFSLAFRLNALAAVAGALILAWLYRLVWFFVFDMMREQSSVIYASRIAHFAGIMAALASGLSLPFWHAATHFRPEIFDVALLTGCAHLLIVYARTQRVFWLLLFGALYGVGVAESPLFIVAAPFMAVFAVIMEWRLVWCQMKILIAAAEVSLLTCVGTYYLGAWAFAKHYNLATNPRAVFGLFPQMLRAQLGMIEHTFPGQLWVPVLAMGVGATVLSYLAAFKALDNRRSWSLLFLNAALTISAVLLLVNVPFAPWGVQVARGVLPVATYVLAGFGLSLLLASWRALAIMDDPVEENQALHDEHKHTVPPACYAATRLAGFLLAPVLAAAIVVCGIVNGVKRLADDGSFADRAADVVLDALHGRTWVVGNGIIDPNLLIRAHERGIPLHLLLPQRAFDRHYTAAILRTLQSDASFAESARLRAESLISYNFLVFIEDLFATDPKIGEKAVTMGLPDMWYGSRWIPVPNLLFYGGVRDLDALQNRDLAAEQQVFWKQWASFLKAGPGSPWQVSYRYRLALRLHLAFVENNLGVILDDMSRPEEAFLAYQKAHAIDPDNISALLNLFEMVSRGLHPEVKDAISTELRHKVENPTQRYSLWALSRYYGYVRNSQLFVQMGWSWALSSNPGSVLAGLRNVYALQPDETKRMGLAAMVAALHEMRGDFAQSAAEYNKVLQRDPRNTVAISGLVRLALRRNIVDEARRILETGKSVGASEHLLLQDWAALYLVAGDLPRARIILQELSDAPDVTPMVLAMLAMVMIEQNEVSTVETTILPKLTKKAGGSKENQYFPLVIQGRIWQSKGKSGYKNAQLCFQRAAAIRPDVQALQEVILMLDAGMENQTAAEAHALMLLRQQPDHPFANFVIGSIRLEQAQFEDAEPYLRRSVAGLNPTADALNNLAQVLCRNHKYAEAERVARQTTEVAPERYEGWSTLAYVLATADKLDAAAAALAKAHDLNAEDPRIFLVDAMLALKRDDTAAAARALAAVGPEAAFSLSDRRDLTDLKVAIANRRQRR